jgi:purine catabolism regulator
MGQLTLGEALGLAAFRDGAPEVKAGAAALERPIRWAHATERTDVAALLRPGDLLLTMGTGLPAADDVEQMAAFVAELVDVGSAGLVIELGRRWVDEVPGSLVDACESAGLPLVVLRHEVRFAALTQAVGEKVVDAQLAELREAQRVHETFTELSFAQAGPAEILQAVRRLADGPVVLENEQHRPLDYLAGPADSDDFLDGWQARSRSVQVARRSDYDERHGWLITRLGAGGQTWGRLIIGCSGAPSQRLVAVAERAAAALALHRLHDRDRGTAVRRQHRELLDRLRDDPYSSDVRVRAQALDFPVANRRFVAVVVCPRAVTPDGERVGDLASTVVRVAHALRVPTLVCEVDREVHVLLSTASGADPDAAVDRLASRLHGYHAVTIAAGRSVDGLGQVAQTMAEAVQVADASQHRGGEGPQVYRLDDLHLRGLLALFGPDERIAAFVERELGALRAYDEAHTASVTLMDTLRALLNHPDNKTSAAESLHLSRAAFYERLAKISTILDVNLDDPETRLSLHVALIASE